MKTLDLVKENTKVRVLKVEAEKELKERLKILGFEKGKEIEILKISFRGKSFLMRAGDSRVGMRKITAQKIFVEEVAET